MTRAYLIQVENIFLNEPIVEPFADYAVQENVPQELAVLSQPPGPEKIKHYRNYVYHSPADRNIFIYHAGLGINGRHEDFRYREVEWVYTGRAIHTGNADETETLIDPSGLFNGHSTCTASKATGNIFGGSKYATLVVVKMPDYTAASVAEVLWTISDHIKSHARNHSSLVLVPWGSRKPANTFRTPEKKYWSQVHRYLRQLTLLDTWCVFAAGNKALHRPSPFGRRRRSMMDTEPGLYLYDQGSATFPQAVLALAVSNINNYGELYPTSQVARSQSIHARNVFAPGVDVKCAAFDSEQGYKIQTGTSFCQYFIFS